MNFSIKQIHEAEKRIRPYIIKTPMIRLAQLDEILGCQVYVKADCMQKTGSFKLRGAMNMILELGIENLRNGIVTASSGNHGRACAYAAKMFNIPVTVVIPDTAPAIKVENIRKLGAEITQCLAVERFDVADRICGERNAVFIPPYNDERIMAGQGTAGLEITEQLPNVDTVLVPTSGGGLLSGIATAVKGTSQAEVIGVEPAQIPRYTASLKAGEPVEVEQKKSIADALVSNHPGTKCFPVIQKNVDRIVTVSDESIIEAQKLLLLEGKIFAEASGCLGIAAVLENKVKFEKNRKVCFFISGGNCLLEQLR